MRYNIYKGDLMKNHRITFCIYVLALFLVFSNHLIMMNDNQSIILEDQMIYKVDDENQAIQLAETYHLKLNHISTSGLATFQITNLSPIDALLELGFSYNLESQILRPPWNSTDEDPYIDQQYALDMMDTIEGWTVTEGSSDVVVAIIDTGIDTNHIEFEGRISALSYNSYTEEVGLEQVEDTHGHGTMVAGIIAANKDNQAGIAGIASNIELMIIKANKDNEGVFQDSAVIEGIYYATDNGADIINLSLGNSTKNIQMELAVNYAYNNGVIVVAAAGNDSVEDPLYPAAFGTTISVSAVDSRYSFAEYSNYGETIDISAPGTDIITTVINNGYGTVSGTSFAAPQVSGVLALMLSYYSSNEIEEMIQRLLKSSNDYGDPGIDIFYGYGLVNTYNALTYDFVGVTFETNGGSDIKPIYVTVNSRLTLPENPVLEDHIFSGWYKDPIFSERFDPDQDIITEDITLYAKFNAEFHTVTFVTPANDVDPLIIYHGNTFNLPESNLDYYIFIGWTIDPENTIPYNGFPIYKDLTLYAHFEPIIYHSIVLYIDGEIYDEVQIETGKLYEPSLFSQIGYTFDGWYIDENYTLPYQSDEPITSDMNIYAKFIPIEYTITLMVDGEIYDTFFGAYGESLSLPHLQKDNQLFLGWYYDISFTKPYQDETVEGELTLYARFSQFAYSITYIIDDEIQTDWYVPDDAFYPVEPYKKGYTFMGWFYDETYTEAYIPTVLQDDIILYAYYEINRYNIRFFDYDGETILFETVLTAGSTVFPPKASDKPDSISFTYEFLEWSESIYDIYEDVDLYPIYKRTFIPNSIQLSPGVDTINQGGEWVDGGLTELDDYLYVVVDQDIDTSIPGQYTILYDIYDEDELLITIERVVRVVEEMPDVILELNPGVTTLLVGSTYEDAGITYNQGSLEVISDVNTSKPGIYKVIYQITVDDFIFEKTRYVHVIDASEDTVTYIYIEKKEDDLYDA